MSSTKETTAGEDDERRFKRMFGCDTARIVTPCGKMFLIIGWKKHTRNLKDRAWYKNGKRFDFEYTEEHCIASGTTMKELTASAKEYKRLCGMSMLDYLREQVSNSAFR